MMSRESRTHLTGMSIGVIHHPSFRIRIIVPIVVSAILANLGVVHSASFIVLAQRDGRALVTDTHTRHRG